MKYITYITYPTKTLYIELFREPQKIIWCGDYRLEHLHFSEAFDEFSSWLYTNSCRYYQ